VFCFDVQLKHCCVKDPSDLYTVNISGQNLTDAVSKDFELFRNVVSINASDNLLSLGLLIVFYFCVLSVYPRDAMRRAGLCDSNVSVCPLQPVLYQNGES